jgi:hypothetical protein
LKKIFLFIPLLVFLTGCPSDDLSTDPVEPVLRAVTHEVVLFEYTPDTGNNTSRLRYEITFSNSNNVPVLGFPRITLNADGVVSSSISSSNSPCYQIDANSNCTLNFDEETSLNLGLINSVELVSVEYIFDE